MIIWMSLFSRRRNGRVTGHTIHPWRLALLIGALYIVAAGIYIILSSQYVAQHAASITDVHLFEMQKGLIFVGVTGNLLVVGLGWVFRRIARQEQKIIDQRNALLISERHAVAGMLASSVAHDINNVLTTLVNTVDFFQATMEQSAQSADYLSRIQEANTQLTALTKRLLQAGNTQKHVEPAHFELEAILTESLEFSKTHNAVHYCTVDIVCPTHIEMVGYPDLIQQMLFNLILNAAQATEGRGDITVTVEPANQHVTVTVQDNGPGIPPDQRETIFEPFYTTKDEGTGLGMLSIQACVEAHGGEIAVGASPHGGAEFTVELPRKVSTA